MNNGPNPLTVIRQCPRCGKYGTYAVTTDAKPTVTCNTCGKQFQVSPLCRPPKVGSPTNPRDIFKYTCAASHHSPEGLRTRLRRYARLNLTWGTA